MEPKKPSAPKPLKTLREGNSLKGLFRKAEAIGRFQRLLESKIQPAARPFCKLAMFREGELLIIVTDGHWATRLRYQQRRLLRELQDIPEFAGLLRIAFKVQPDVTTTHAQRAAPLLSQAAAESIQSSAECIADPGLKAAMERLAKHTKKNP